ncbi:MAG: enoyl-CoA hydratase-related protein [Actinomycetota bacterium]|nr:enoyl-CoA hydratase-related protein [Actinomycetota bacterium]
MGLLHFAVPDKQLEEFTHELAREFASSAPLSIAGMKRTLNLLSSYVPLGDKEQAGVDVMIARALFSGDAVEAMAAFREKREPRFKGE